MEGTSGAVDLVYFREKTGEAALTGESLFGVANPASWFGFPSP